MRTIVIILGIVFCLLLFPATLYAQNIYDLRRLTDEDWIGMSTEERLSALGISNSHARNQTYLGSFGRSYDLYPRWGYDYYEMEDRYENYAFRGFENYHIINDRRNRWYYNQFGDRLTKMRRNANIWSFSIRIESSTSKYFSNFLSTSEISVLISSIGRMLITSFKTKGLIS